MCNVTLKSVHEIIVAAESNKYYIFLCVCVRARECVRASGSVGVCMRGRACGFVYPTCNSYMPYYDVICGPPCSAIFFDIIS
jgi:hypothetical protein